MILQTILEELIKKYDCNDHYNESWRKENIAQAVKKIEALIPEKKSLMPYLLKEKDYDYNKLVCSKRRGWNACIAALRTKLGLEKGQ